MNKINVCILFGGISPEHEVSLRSAESVLSNLDKEKYDIYPVGITRRGEWILYGSEDYSLLPSGQWLRCEENRPATVSPVRGQGLLILEENSVRNQPIDVAFPVLHGENGEDGSVQGLFQLAGIPCVGPGVASSATCMDKTLTKLVCDNASIPQAAWELVTAESLEKSLGKVMDRIEGRFNYPVFVKPAGTGSSVGVAKAKDRTALEKALLNAAQFDTKILVEEFIHGREVEVAVMGNGNPVASICGEIEAGAEFYDYEAKYISDCSTLHIPARIDEATGEKVRELAIRAYKALGCRGLSRVDFFVTFADSKIVFNEINTLPGFTSISMYPKLFAASGIPYSQLLDRLLELAREN